VSVTCRLFQLASQALPIGGFSYSQGLESAIEAGVVADEISLLRWVADLLEFSQCTYEIPCLFEMHDHWASRDFAALVAANAEFLAAREAAELRAMSVQMGHSMARLAHGFTEMPSWLTGTLAQVQEPGLPCVWSGVAHAWGIAAEDSAAAYLWSWTENQVLAAIKALPLGQSSGQRVLMRAGEFIDRFMRMPDAPFRCAAERRSNFAPALAIFSAAHETQYSRIFRS
jgi:urease accessory protein